MRNLAQRRLENQHLVAPTLRDAAAVVGALAAVQAQDYGSAKWAIAQRTPGLGDADVERAIATGTILRTHVLRPTWHFVLPEDARWVLELTAPRVAQAMAYHSANCARRCVAPGSTCQRESVSGICWCRQSSIA